MRDLIMNYQILNENELRRKFRASKRNKNSEEVFKQKVKRIAFNVTSLIDSKLKHFKTAL